MILGSKWGNEQTNLETEENEVKEGEVPARIGLRRLAICGGSLIWSSLVEWTSKLS